MIKFIAKKLCGYDELKKRHNELFDLWVKQRSSIHQMQIAVDQANTEIGKLKGKLQAMTDDRDFHQKDAQQFQKDANLAATTLEWVVAQETPNSSGTVKKIVRRCREIAEQLGV